MPGSRPVGSEPAGPLLPGPLRAVSRGWEMLRGVVGADKYERYVRFHQQSGCGEPPLSRREFWREHYRDQDRNPGSRCC